jgi:hypothetical protein
MKIAFPALALVASLALAGAALAQPQEGGHNNAMRAACAADLQSLCKDVQPGGGRIMQCLKEHKDAVSAPCKSAIAERMSERRASHHGDTAAPPPSN